MEVNSNIEILPVGNGYIVRSPLERDMAINESDYKVFASFDSLTYWLAEHFEYRNAHLINDSKTSL